MVIRRVILGLVMVVLFPSGVLPEELNLRCPFQSTFVPFDLAYHSCSNGHVKDQGSCGTFVELFQKLIPRYDCARSFDTGPVPAIWLAEGGAVEDYVRLLHRLAIREAPYDAKWFEKPSTEGKRLFGSPEFRTILDGHLLGVPPSIREASSRIHTGAIAWHRDS